MTQKYIVPKDVVTSLETLDLSVQALKLVHGLLMQADRDVDGQTSLLCQAMNRSEILRASHINELVGWHRENGNRSLKKALVDPELKKVLGNVELTENSRGIVRTFTRSFCDLATVRNFDPINERHLYALLTSDGISTCRTAFDVLFYTRVAMHERGKYPTFEIPGIGTKELVQPRFGKQSGYDKAAADFKAKITPSTETTIAKISWPKVRDKWLSAARRASILTGYTFVVHVEQAITHNDTRRVQVKWTGPNSKWQMDRLYKCAGNSKMAIVNEEGHRFLGRDEIKKLACGE